MKRSLTALLATTAVATGIALTPMSATAGPLWTCSTIAGQYMEFKQGTPVHSQPAGSSPVRAELWGGWQWIDGSCISNAGNQWWRMSLGSSYGYIWDNYRLDG
ncbi:hypothetical protein [Streptomyces hirsutus]|uniref:hypothetical protein n=1 Tax=Streptomyces hirsutus TaxID=35620 RepID=UPI0036C920D4